MWASFKSPNSSAVINAFTKLFTRFTTCLVSTSAFEDTLENQFFRITDFTDIPSILCIRFLSSYIKTAFSGIHQPANIVFCKRLSHNRLLVFSFNLKKWHRRIAIPTQTIRNLLCLLQLLCLWLNNFIRIGLHSDQELVLKNLEHISLRYFSVYN